MIEVGPGDQLVARLWRWDEERLRNDAELDHRDQLAQGIPDPDYSVSVFASDVAAEDFDPEGAIDELKAHVKQYRNSRWVAFTTRRRLEEQGFPVRLNEPPPRHYDVVLGTDLASADVAGLASIFGEHERQRLVQ